VSEVFSVLFLEIFRPIKENKKRNFKFCNILVVPMLLHSNKIWALRRTGINFRQQK
jgi:hypothetical protein